MTATRDELLDAVFDGRDDSSKRAYLRQAIGQLARALQDPEALSSRDGVVRLASIGRARYWLGFFHQAPTVLRPGLPPYAASCRSSGLSRGH